MEETGTGSETLALLKRTHSGEWRSMGRAEREVILLQSDVILLAQMDTVVSMSPTESLGLYPLHVRRRI